MYGAVVPAVTRSEASLAQPSFTVSYCRLSSAT